uniref:C-type lectin domain family 4 member K-like n=1 Tax=Semicossyphus pulcher TaxID=241346 RepID=UPI0037E81BA7
MSTFDGKSGEGGGDTRYLMGIDDGIQNKRRSQSLVWGIGAAAVCLTLLLLTVILVANNTSAMSRWDTKYENLIFNLSKSRGASVDKPGDLRDDRDQQKIQSANLTKGIRDALRDEREALRDEREALRVERDALRAEREVLRNERDQLKIQSSNMTKDRDSVRDERGALKDERVALKDERTHLNIYFSNLTDYRDALRDEREALRDERGALKGDRDQVRNQSNLTGDRDVLSHERDALRDEREALKVERGVLKEERGALKEEREHFKILSSNLTRDRDVLRDERDALRDERDQLKIQSSNLTKEVEALQNRSEALAESRHKLQEEVDALKLSQQTKTCFQGWTMFNNKCYYYSRNGVFETWGKSRQDCQARGGDLAMPTTKEELTFASRGNAITWIGLTDKLQEGQWQWVDGRDLEGVGFWKKGEPNDTGSNEDCVEVSRDEVKWNDAPCDRKFSWVCEA